jgi:5-methylcytosine-specific restriction enzyme A
MRSVPEWIGRNDDQPVPMRVRLRVFEKFGKACAGCGLSLLGKRWTCDHAVALINGGENRENNLRPLGDACCNPDKNRADVAQKSQAYASRSRHYGIRKSKVPFRGWRRFDGTPVRNPRL